MERDFKRRETSKMHRGTGLGEWSARNGGREHRKVECAERMREGRTVRGRDSLWRDACVVGRDVERSDGGTRVRK